MAPQRAPRAGRPSAPRSSQQAGNQRAQHHAQQLDAGHQRLQFDVAHRQPLQEGRVLQPLGQRASSRSSTWPSPNGTDAGNSSATGHRASSTSAPRESSTNQRSRKRLQRSIAPRPFQHPGASDAPSQAPARFSKRSTLDATRTAGSFAAFHDQRQQAAASVASSTARTAGCRQAHRAQRQQEAQRPVARHVGGDVKAGPVAGQGRWPERPRAQCPGRASRRTGTGWHRRPAPHRSAPGARLMSCARRQAGLRRA
jgi:hypothetical protein